MIEAVLFSLGMWIGFIIISSAIIVLAFVGAKYILNMMDKADIWYNKKDEKHE